MPNASIEVYIGNKRFNFNIERLKLALLNGDYTRYIILWVIYRINKVIAGIIQNPNRYLNELNSLKDDMSRVCIENNIEIKKVVYQFSYENDLDSILDISYSSEDTDDEYACNISGAFNNFISAVIDAAESNEKRKNRFVAYLSDTKTDVTSSLSISDGVQLMDKINQSHERPVYLDESIHSNLNQIMRYLIDRYNLGSRPSLFKYGELNKNPDCRRLYILYKTVLFAVVHLINGESAMILIDSVYFTDRKIEDIVMSLLGSFVQSGGTVIIATGRNI